MTQSYDSRITRLESEMQQLKASTSIKPIFRDPINNGIDLPDGTVTAAKILDGSITATKYAALSVTAAAIGDLAVTSAKIADLAVTSAKIASLEADKITAGSGIITDLLVKSKLTISTGGIIQVGDYVRLTSDGLSLVVTDSPNVVGEDDKKISHVSADYLTTYAERFGVFNSGLNSAYIIDRVFLKTDSYILQGIWDVANSKYDTYTILSNSATGFPSIWSVNEGNATVLGLKRISATSWELWMLKSGTYQKIA